MKNNLNLIFAAIFMMGFLVFWDAVVMSRYSSKNKPTAEAVSQATEEAKLTQTAVAIAAGDNPKEESVTTLQTPDTKVTLLSKGARVGSWQVRERDHWIELVEPERKRLISPLETYPNVNFSVAKISDAEAVFTGKLPDGLVMTKTIKLFAEPPFHSISIVFSNPSPREIAVDAALPLGNGIDKHQVGTPYDPKQEGAVIAETRVAALADRVKSWSPGLIFNRTIDKFDPTSFKWMTVDNNHFMMTLLPQEGLIAGVHAVADRKHPPSVEIPFKFILKPGDTLAKKFRLYAGPKDYNDLKKIGSDLADAVNFGFFGVIAKVLLKILIFLESLTGNYGWAIIILTFCLQILMFPLTRKNLSHSARMRELQPQLKKLQEQFKSDPKRMQVETFNLYKKNGMKFMGMEGCFPMLLQIPVFFAFYSTLRVAYELRGAPWIFWIKDLGVHDPYYVLPVIMGGGMFLQQKLTAVAADPAQARMMMFMPIMFMFMFMKLPAGLVLYWCMNSMTTIVIQKILSSKKDSSLQLAT